MRSSEEPRILRVELPPGLDLLNANERAFLRKNKKGQRVPSNAKTIEGIRDAAQKAAEDIPFMPFPRCRIRCIIRHPDNRKRDSFNWAPSCKAAIDGIVKAGVIRDDCDSIVREVSVVCGENRTDKKSQLIVQVIEDAGD